MNVGEPIILVGCDESGTFPAALRRYGATVASCDFKASKLPGWHIRGDVREAIRMRPFGRRWDAAIFHPTCRYLTNAGVRWLYQSGKRWNADGSENPIDAQRWADMEAGCAFFLECLNADIPFVAVENPVMHEHAAKIIGEDFAFSYHPHEHGEPEFKRTCWWLRGLPIVGPSNQLPDVPKPGTEEHKAWSKVHRMAPGADREEKRSETLEGVANALAATWVPFIRQQINQKAAA